MTLEFISDFDFFILVDGLSMENYPVETLARVQYNTLRIGSLAITVIDPWMKLKMKIEYINLDRLEL